MAAIRRRKKSAPVVSIKHVPSCGHNEGEACTHSSRKRVRTAEREPVKINLKRRAFCALFRPSVSGEIEEAILVEAKIWQKFSVAARGRIRRERRRQS